VPENFLQDEGDVGHGRERVGPFDEIYEQHVDFVWRSARRMGVGEGHLDDVVQQVFIVVHRRLPELLEPASTKSWIFSIVHRVVADYRRTLRRKSPHWFGGDPIEPDELAAAGTPHDDLVRAEGEQLLTRLLAQLDGDKRTVFMLAELEQMTAPEIAIATGLSVEKVYSRLRAARTDFDRAAATIRRDLTLAERSP
jgi:RNA polymerase sigma-70 factor (ECF subfamily)